ncbi:hypothetical protein EAH79_07365 [Sphingomonas koreensis]|nr:hypothetical protein EAH79_07365 [Sphingomonas koreensis]
MDTISHTTTALPALADRNHRCDGWTPDRQRAFLEAIAEGHTVGSACALVGMAPSSAYALRRRAAGAGFALGWRAANLLAREKVADTLLARAIDGQVETLTRPDGETITRHRYDNRLASTMLARLDRFADKDAGEATHQAARLVAAEFDGFLDLIDRNEGPARTGIFLAARIAGDEVDPDLGAVLSLARADRWLRTGRGAASEIDVADLDPDARTGWTAEQWVRAEAAGLVAFASPAEPARHSPLSPLHPDEDDETVEDQPIWWDGMEHQWLTSFAPPPGFDGEEDGDYGDDDYSRTLTPEEEQVVEAHHRAERAQRLAAAAPERDAWFAGLSDALEPAAAEPRPPAAPAATPPEPRPPHQPAAAAPPAANAPAPPGGRASTSADAFDALVPPAPPTPPPFPLDARSGNADARLSFLGT